MTGEVVFSLRGVSAARGAGEVLREVSIQLRAGEITAVIGPNGAGKSSLIGVLGGSLRYQRGEVLLAQRSLDAWSSLDRAARVAVLPQSSSLTFPFTVRDVVAMGRTPHRRGLATDRAVVDDCLQRCDVTHLAERRYPSLSGGEQRRVQLARVLAQLMPASGCALQGQALLLDEPTAALDLRHQRLLRQLLAELAARGCCVLFTTHDINLAADLASQMIALREGCIEGAGEPGVLMQPALLGAIFDTPFECLDRGPGRVPHALAR